jgi:hypothetical protein
MKLHVINAFEGDCLLLEDDDGVQPRFALVDGGPRGTFEGHLGSYLGQVITPAGTLDAVIVSHIDADHISGVLDLLADIEARYVDGAATTISVADLWHNSFARTLNDADGNLSSNLQAMMSLAGKAQFAAANGSIALLGIAQGEKLRRQALKLGIPINGAFNNELISVETQAGVEWSLGNSRFRIAGPTRGNLDELRAEWVKWIDDHLDQFAEGDQQAMSNADRSIPNLSSIVLVGTTPDGDLLLTGDARGDHIIQGLEQSGEIAPGGTRHFRLLKLQHHGSIRNVAHEFFERLTADIYVISADGKNGNPDLGTLTMLVDAAHAQGRAPLIVVTNEPESVDQLRVQRPKATFGYELAARATDRPAIVIDLATGAVA